MSDFPRLASVHATAAHCKAAGIPLPEKAIRRFVKNGTLPAVQTGKKSLILWNNVLLFVKKGNNSPRENECAGSGIRRIVE